MKSLLALIVLSLMAITAIAAPRSATPFYLLFSSTNVTTTAYTTVISSLPKSTKELVVYNTCATPIILGVGAAGVEASQLIVPPMTAGSTPARFGIAISQGQRIAALASVSSCSSGALELNAIYN